MRPEDGIRSTHASDELASQLDAAQRHLSELADRAQSSSGDQIVQEALHGMGSTIEELRVALEEIRARNEELLLTREVADEAARHYRDLFDMTPDAYIVTTADGTIVEANQAADSLLEPRRSLQAKPVQGLISERERRAFRDQLAGLVETDVVSSWEWRIWPRHRPIFDASIRLVPIRARDGRPDRVRWMIRNVSIDRETAARLRRAEERLV